MAAAASRAKVMMVAKHRYKLFTTTSTRKILDWQARHHWSARTNGCTAHEDPGCCVEGCVHNSVIALSRPKLLPGGVLEITCEATVSTFSSPYFSTLRDCRCLVRCQVSVCHKFIGQKSASTRRVVGTSLDFRSHPVRSSQGLHRLRALHCLCRRHSQER